MGKDELGCSRRVPGGLCLGWLHHGISFLSGISHAEVCSRYVPLATSPGVSHTAFGHLDGFTRGRRTDSNTYTLIG